MLDWTKKIKAFCGKTIKTVKQKTATITTEILTKNIKKIKKLFNFLTKLISLSIGYQNLIILFF